MAQRPAPVGQTGQVRRVGRRRVALAAGVAFALVSAGLVGRPARSLAIDPLGERQEGVMTTPAHDPASQNVRDIRAWFAGLSNVSPRVRESAAEHLMRLRRHDLSTVRKVVQERLPLRPEEQEALRDVVEQAWMTEAPYLANPRQGFLGVVFDPDQTFGPDESPYGGVEIRHRLAGFCASRNLLDGDVVLSINVGGNTIELHRSQELRDSVGLLPSGQAVTLEVLRRGRLVQVPLKLDAHPQDVTSEDRLAEFIAQRQAEFDGYWEEQFQPLFDGRVPRPAGVQALAR